ncbi:MAG: hypothetical protein HQK75_19790, partial [Candidatus Magnetomorum sp.]|nr:hypothetical protein [Candidatus Magnetomorum sp.]
YHSLAIKDDGSVWAWGYNEYGQLGCGYPIFLPEPVYSKIRFRQKTFTTSQNTTIMIPVLNTAQKNITVSFTTIDGSAVSGFDYLHTSGNLTFQSNETQKEIPITILNNPENLTEKTFVLNIGAPDDIFLNDTSQAIITISSRYSVIPPYSQTFTQHMPASGWEFNYWAYGRIQQTAGLMRMDSIQDNTYSLNEAILHIDLSSAKNINLSFFQKSIASDICTSLPERYTNPFNGDGVSISNDGYTWYRLMDSSDLMTDALGKNYTLNLSEFESAIQANYDKDFHLNRLTQIKFQQYGNRTYPSGGREWDNIVVTSDPKPVIQFQQFTHMVANDGSLYIPVMRTGNLDTTVSVDYATQEGKAIANQDYAESSGKLVFMPGEATQYIKVTILADIFRNQDVYFFLNLSNPSDGMSLGNIQTSQISISCHQIMTQSYEQSFDLFMPASGWQYYSSDSHGRIQVENYVLRMDTISKDQPVLNEAELYMNLAWADQVRLFFTHQSYETADPIPDMYTEHVNGDGVSISMDGITWYRIVQAADLENPYTTWTVHINEKMTEIDNQYGIGTELCDDFRFRFQQYNALPGMLGRDWDDIKIQVLGNILELPVNKTAMPDDNFTIPLTLNNPNKQPIKGIYAVLTFDSTVLTPKSASLANGFLNPEDYQVDISTSVPNELLISIYCRTTAYAYSSGTAALLTFQAGSRRFDESDIAFDVAEINESPVNARDAHFMVKNDRPMIAITRPKTITMSEDMTYSGITITVSDTETSAEQLQLTAITSNPVLFPVDKQHFQFGGSQQNRTLWITPALNQSGSATITLVVADEKGLTQTAGINVQVIAVPDPPLFTFDATPCGNEDSPISLTILASLQDTDGSEYLSSVNILNVPEGTVFSDGTQLTDHIWIFSESDLQHLTITPPLHNDADFDLLLYVTSTEISNSQTISTTQTIHVSVLAVADPYTGSIPETIYGNSDVYFPMHMLANRTDVDDSETLNLIVSGMPAGAKLSAGTDNGDGTWTLSENEIPEAQIIPPHQDDKEFTLTITILIKEANDNAIWRKDFTLNVEVTGYQIVGKVSYYNNDIPVRNVLMTLSGDLTYTTVTDETGQYVIPAVSPGYYKLTPSKNDDLLGVSQTDASDISRFIIHAHDLTCTTLIAADVSLNRSISPRDVSDVSTYAIPGLLKDCFNDSCQSWTFSSHRPESCVDQVVQSTPYRQYIFLDTDQTNQNFMAFRLGDVTGNWQPDNTPPASTTPRARFNARLLASDSAQESYPFTVAVAMEDSLAIRGIDMRMTFDPSVITPKSVLLSGSVLENSDYELIYGTGISGEISVGIYARNEILTTSGKIVFIQFDFTGSESKSSPLTFIRFDINEQPATGGFIVEDRLSPQVEVALDLGIPKLFDTAYDTPVASEKTWSTNENTPISIQLSGKSPENYSLTYQLIQFPAHGTITGQEPDLTYTPEQNFYGVDYIRFIVNDGHSDSEPGQVTIYVERPSTYPLELLSNQEGQVKINNTLLQIPGIYSYAADAHICIEAIPGSEWTFLKWLGDMVSFNNPVCFTMDHAKTLTAMVDIKKFQVQIQGSGTIEINGQTCQLPYSQAFEIHTQLSIQSKEPLFRCWTGDISKYDNPATIEITNAITIIPQYYPLPKWKTPMIVERLVDGSDIKISHEVHIGVASSSYTKVSGLLPENQTCHSVIYGTGSELLSLDIQEENFKKHIWYLGVNPLGSLGNQAFDTTAILSWDPQTFASDGEYLLIDGYDENDPVLISDMRTTHSYAVTDNSYHGLTVIWRQYSVFTFHMKKGWNLISLPYAPDNAAISSIFPDYLLAYEYKNSVYIEATEFKTGKGYWINVPADADYVMEGKKLDNASINLPPGWHLTGPNAGINLEQAERKFRFKNGVYIEVDTLLPGLGYWVLLGEND